MPAWSGQPVPGGGSLRPFSFFNPASINRSGRIAFTAEVTGSPRNQGIFVADAGGITPIAIGCGGGGGGTDPGTGCGDASPLGGTFSGFFGGTFFLPDINDGGDVLFLADVDGGSARRGLFLYLADSHEIVKVAAPGDPSPLGGTFDAVGPGSLNNARQVAFLASKPDDHTSDVFLWKTGSVTKYVAAGDPAPGGGNFLVVGGEALGFVDGTWIPVGPIPGLNNQGQISFRGFLDTGTSGLLVSRDGVHEWYVRSGDPTPAGGVYLGFDGPVLNDAGQIAFFSDLQGGPGGWFVGSPGSWRKALQFFDTVDGGQVNILAVSRNPMRPLNDEGDLLVWCDVGPSHGEDRLVVSRHDGTLVVVARRGDPTPLLGQISGMQAWPSFVSSRATLGAATPGAPFSDAQMVVDVGAEGGTRWYRDSDGDGYGDPSEQVLSCAQPGDHVAVAGDCDDTNPALHPGALETCNGLDDNCNGHVDDGLGTSTCGIGACRRTTDNCIAGVPYPCVPGDPSPEACNGIDDNCNGQVDEGLSRSVGHIRLVCNPHLGGLEPR